MPEYVSIAWMPGEADGAIPNGRPVVKVDGDGADMHAVGARGTVIASHLVTPEILAKMLAASPGTRAVKFMYFVAWDDNPKIPVGVSDWKIAEAP